VCEDLEQFFLNCQEHLIMRQEVESLNGIHFSFNTIITFVQFLLRKISIQFSWNECEIQLYFKCFVSSESTQIAWYNLLQRNLLELKNMYMNLRAELWRDPLIESTG